MPKSSLLIGNKNGYWKLSWPDGLKNVTWTESCKIEKNLHIIKEVTLRGSGCRGGGEQDGVGGGGSCGAGGEQDEKGEGAAAATAAPEGSRQ